MKDLCGTSESITIPNNYKEKIIPLQNGETWWIPPEMVTEVNSPRNGTFNDGALLLWYFC